MKTALIIEDEIPAGEMLSRLLASNGFVVVGNCRSVRSAKHWFSKNKHPEFVFSDIKLSDGSAFEILREVTVASRIIFTTAYSQHALEAFACNGLDYMLKPVNQQKLDNLALKLMLLTPSKPDWNFLEQSVGDNFRKSFVVVTARSIKKIESDEVKFFKSENNTTFLFDGARSYAMSESLDKLETQLNPKHFFRISRKHFVNRSSILRFDTITACAVLYGEELPVSRSRVTDFIKWFSTH